MLKLQILYQMLKRLPKPYYLDFKVSHEMVMFLVLSYWSHFFLSFSERVSGASPYLFHLSLSALSQFLLHKKQRVPIITITDMMSTIANPTVHSFFNEIVVYHLMHSSSFASMNNFLFSYRDIFFKF